MIGDPGEPEPVSEDVAALVKSCKPGCIDEWMRWPYQAWDADATFSGYNHIYERVMIDGFPYIRPEPG